MKKCFNNIYRRSRNTKNDSQVIQFIQFLHLWIIIFIFIVCIAIYQNQSIISFLNILLLMYRLFTKLKSFYSHMQIQKQYKIGTHDGTFHCDEVLACLLLSKYSNKFRNADIVRTRNQKLLEQCDIIVDVGGKFSPPKYFDHHQREFTDTHPNFKIRLSSAGLVYLNFAQLVPNIIQQIIKNTKTPFKVNLTPEIQTQIRNRIYENFILAVDANDNGIEMCEKSQILYKVNSALWNRISRCNPMWWEQNKNEFQCFKKAMQIADEEIVEQIKQLLLGHFQVKSMVLQAFNQRLKHHNSGQIVVLNQYIPWQNSIFQIEKQNNLQGKIKFVIFPQKGNPAWRVQAVPSKQGAFSLRKGLREQWRGIKQMDQLIKVSNINDIVFVHNSGFIGGAKSFENTLKMAELSL